MSAGIGGSYLPRCSPLSQLLSVAEQSQSVQEETQHYHSGHVRSTGVPKTIPQDTVAGERESEMQAGGVPMSRFEFANGLSL